MSTIVLVHGVFDLLHAGHVEHLRQAKKFGDTLVVSVVPDKFATKRQPIYSEDERLALLHAIRYVDHAFLCGAPGPEEVLIRFKPNIYVRSEEYATMEAPEYALVRKLGIAVGFTKSIPPHTTDILERIYALRKPE